MAPNNSRSYVLEDPEEGFWVFVNVWHTSTVYINDQPARSREAKPDAGSRYNDWWWSPDEPRKLSVVGPPTKVTTHYELPEGVTTPEGSPITIETYRSLHQEDAPRFPWVELYVPVTEDRAPEVTELEPPLMLLPGGPPAEDDRKWQAKLPYEIRERREYLHLFPGELVGFKDTLNNYLGTRLFGGGMLPGVTSHEDRDSRALRISRTVTFDPDLTTTKKMPGRRKKVPVPRTVTRDLYLLVPDNVSGQNYADAARRWDALWAKAMELIEATNVKACGHCETRGWVSDGPGENGERVVLQNEMGWAAT